MCESIRKGCFLHICNVEFNVSVLQACLNHSLLGSLDHLVSEIYPNYHPLRPNLVSRQYDVYTAAAAEIYHHFAGLKVGEPGWIAATPREVKRDFGQERKLFLAINPQFYRVARTGLSLARSTGLFLSACFSKFAVAVLDHLSDFVNVHLAFLLL